MNAADAFDALIVGLVGLSICAAVAVNSRFTASRLPPIVGYIAVGFVIRLVDSRLPFLTPPVLHAFRFLSDLGIVALLFAIGLQCHPRGLAARLPLASLIWVSNMTLAFLLGFAAAFWVLKTGLVTALVLATALSATSVGVAVGAWTAAGAIRSPAGELLVDVAELDDISAVALMAVLVASATALASGNGAASGAFWTLLDFGLRFGLFVVACLLFAQFGEHRVTAFAAGMREPPQRMLVVAGVGFLIAALAALLGFSLAVGALAAGLVFSRDPQAVRTQDSFADISAFAIPFFFIGIGLLIEPTSLVAAVWPGVVLCAAGIAGKLIGTFLPAYFAIGGGGATLLAVSMVPRAEIAMVVMDQGRQLLGEPGRLYAAMVFVTAVTSIGAPVLLHRLFRRRRAR